MYSVFFPTIPSTSSPQPHPCIYPLSAWLFLLLPSRLKLLPLESISLLCAQTGLGVSSGLPSSITQPLCCIVFITSFFTSRHGHLGSGSAFSLHLSASRPQRYPKQWVEGKKDRGPSALCHHPMRTLMGTPGKGGSPAFHEYWLSFWAAGLVWCRYWGWCTFWICCFHVGCQETESQLPCLPGEWMDPLQRDWSCPWSPLLLSTSVVLTVFRRKSPELILPLVTFVAFYVPLEVASRPSSSKTENELIV